jgi:hypothetical protein
MKKKLHGFAALVKARGEQQVEEDAQCRLQKALTFAERHGLTAVDIACGRPQNKNVYDRIIAKMGRRHQMTVAIEELAELTKELTKAIRGKPNDMKISEEVADVEVCLDQLKLMFDADGSKTQMFKEFKIDRLWKFYVEGGHR